MPPTRTLAPPRFDIGRYSDNELVLFDAAKQESWIIYPPRSAYDFLHLRRPSKSVTVVEYHPWAPLSVTQDHHVQAATMLALAQQTADTHMAQSKAEAERLVTEAQATAHSTLSSAQAQAQQHVGEAHQRADQLDRESNARAIKILQDAEQRAATITAQFEQRKDALERRVEQLRTFEREYRTRLKSYLESQLRDLDASGRAEPAAAPPVQEPANQQS